MGTKLSPVGSSQSGGGSIGPTTPTDFTEGSVIFAGVSELAENNAALKWTDSTTQLKLTAGAATRTPLAVKAAVAQSANLQEWQNSSDVALAAILSTGAMRVPIGAFPSTPGLQFGTGTILMSRGADGELTIADSTGATAMQFSTPNLALSVGSSIQIGIASTSNPAASGNDVAFARTAAGIMKVTNGSTGGGSLHFQEQTAPSAPAANNVYIYAQDNGAGKTQLMARFATGAAQQIAIEP